MAGPIDFEDYPILSIDRLAGLEQRAGFPQAVIVVENRWQPFVIISHCIPKETHS